MTAAGTSRLAAMWKGLQERELKLWHMIVGFVCATLISTALGQFAQSWGNQQEMNAQIYRDRSQNLLDYASDFENRVSAFVSSSDEFSTLSPTDSALLQANIESQISALIKLRQLFSHQESIDLADQYAFQLVKVRELLADGFEPLETIEFGVAALEIVRLRDALLS